MRRIVLFAFLLVFGALSATGQPVSWKQQTQDFQPGTTGPASNFVQTIEAAGDSLWLGPQLTLYAENPAERSADNCPQEGASCFQTVDVPAFTRADNVVFGLDVPDPSTIWAGLAFDTGTGAPGTAGFLVSTDGGETFERTPTQLDDATDTTVAYGDNALSAIPIVEEENTAPQSIDLNPRTGRVWVAGARTGHRWSDDGGETWNRAVLPPDTSALISPDSTYDFLVSPPLNDGRGHLNHVGFSILVDAEGVVWAGTPNGLNRSDSLFTSGQRSWRHITFDGTPDGLTGNSVVVIDEQPLADRRNPVWIASWAAGNQNEARSERFGVTVTEDGGATFRQALLGERIRDFAFRAETVYATAGTSGLFVSTDGGRRWRSVTDFPLSEASTSQALPRDLEVRAVTTSSESLWLGTSDGLLRLPRGGEEDLARGGSPEWTLFRTSAPVNPDRPTDEAPDVDTYAYPNPFSPAEAEFVRIRFEVDDPTTAEVNVYDFGMNRVRSFTRQVSGGQAEVTWDGTDEGGLRLPNGPYFYTVDTGSGTVRGKILLVE